MKEKIYLTKEQKMKFAWELFQKRIPNPIEGQSDIIVPWDDFELEAFRKDDNYLVRDNDVYKFITIKN